MRAEAAAPAVARDADVGGSQAPGEDAVTRTAPADAEERVLPRVRLRRLGIDDAEPTVYLHRDGPAARVLGAAPGARVVVRCRGRAVEATLGVVGSALLEPGALGLSERAWVLLDRPDVDAGDDADGAWATCAYAPPPPSLRALRAKVYGARLDEPAYRAIVADIAAERYAAIEIAAFVAACAGGRLDAGETVSLTRAMLDSGDRLTWDRDRVVDKHCVGGLPGNRTSLIVVPIVAACGLTMPKTSSRAITSPAGTADTMETLAPVELDLAATRRVVEREGGCIVWGGAMRLSPADDVIIRVERPLDLDSEGQLVASVLSKKAAAGATHVVIDVPVGPTAKVRGAAAAETLAARLTTVGHALGLTVHVVRTDGTQPVGHGIGPALEARDVLAVLRNAPGAPADLRERALRLAAAVLELGGAVPLGEGAAVAEAALADGRASRKFEAIAEAQGGLRTPPAAPHRRVVVAAGDGVVRTIDNRRIARVAKLAGAPAMPAAGVELHARVGAAVAAGTPLFAIHADSPGRLDYAAAYAAVAPPLDVVPEL
jgi:thymidine phosphorylase